MPPTLAPRDTQVTWFPTWVLECSALPHTYATRDLSTPGTSLIGTPFEVGDSEVGGADLIGGGSGSAALHAWGRIVDSPTITRRITDPLAPTVEVQSISLKVAEQLSGDYVASPFTVSRYDEVSGVRLYEFHGIITQTTLDRDGTTIEGTTVDRAILEEEVPVGVVDTATFPQAPAESIGRTIPWVFGNVTSLPLICVRDDQVNSIFDYLVCRGEAAAITGVRRLALNPDAVSPQTEFIVDPIELEPWPGMDGVLENAGLEDWDAGVATDPDGWNLNGAGATVAKNLTPAQVSEGRASASLTRVGTDCFLQQNIAVTLAATLPITWWQGREVTFRADAFATVASRGRLEIYDGVGTTASGFHTGGGTYEDLFVTRTLDAAATVARVRFRVDTGNTTVHYDNVRVYLKAKSMDPANAMAEILRTDLYPGYTAIRFYLRQEDSSGSLHQIVADVNGLQPERNPVRAIRTLLTDPTHSIGQTVDADSFDAGEIATCLTYHDAILLDAPELYLPFHEPNLDVAAQTRTTFDRSGHERHGVYDKGTGLTDDFFPVGPSGSDNDVYLLQNVSSDDWIEVASGLVPSGQAVSVEFWYQCTNLPDTPLRPILEKLIGASPFSGYGFYRELNLLVFFVRGADAVLYFVTSPLVDVVDEDRWMHVVATAEGGVLKLYRDGVLVATGAYTGALAEGDGAVLIGKSASGAFGRDAYTKIALYRHALSADRVTAHVAALPLLIEPLGGYNIFPHAPEVYYAWSEDPAGSVTMVDGSGNGHDGAWVGTPTLGVTGPLNHARGFINSGGAARFVNNIAQRGVETGLTLADTSATLLVWYKPAALKAQSGICEKTIGGVRATQWGLRQAGQVIRFTLVAASGPHTFDMPLAADDVGRWTFLAVRWNTVGSVVRLHKNGTLALIETSAFTAPLASGVGDFYVGCQGTSGGVLTRPASGDIGHLSYHAVGVSGDEITTLWTAATWYNGGLLVDAALTEPRQLQDWLTDIGRLRGIRLDFTPTGTITVSVDTPPTSILIDARDGVGDGDRNIVAISGRQKPRLEDRVRDVVVKYRRDLRTGEWLHKARRAISTKVDANGRRIGRNVVFACPAIREHPTADRFADYAAKRLACEDSVTVTLHQEARRLREGDLIQVTDQLLDYASEIMEVREVNKTLETIEAMVYVWDEAIHTYTPSSFPPGATSE